MGGSLSIALSRFAQVRDARRSDKLPSPTEARSGQVRWREIVITAYGPTILIAVGQGTILPLVALSARELGASVGMAAFIVALIGIGQLVGDLPAGALAARIGEKRALTHRLRARRSRSARCIPGRIRAVACDRHHGHGRCRCGLQPGPSGLSHRGHPDIDAGPRTFQPGGQLPGGIVHRTIHRGGDRDAMEHRRRVRVCRSHEPRRRCPDRIPARHQYKPRAAAAPTPGDTGQ